MWNFNLQLQFVSHVYYVDFADELEVQELLKNCKLFAMFNSLLNTLIWMAKIQGCQL